MTLNILAGASPYSVKVKGQVRAAKDWQEVKEGYENRLCSAMKRVVEFKNLVLYCLEAVPYLNFTIVELLMQPQYGFRQRFDVLSALLRKELKVELFAQLPDISYKVALKVYDKIYSKE